MCKGAALHRVYCKHGCRYFESLLLGARGFANTPVATVKSASKDALANLRYYSASNYRFKVFCFDAQPSLRLLSIPRPYSYFASKTFVALLFRLCPRICWCGWFAAREAFWDLLCHLFEGSSVESSWNPSLTLRNLLESLAALINFHQISTRSYWNDLDLRMG